MIGKPCSARAARLAVMFCTHPDLDNTDRLMLACLGEHADFGTGKNSHPGNARLMLLLGLQKRAVQDRAALNIRRGLITRTKRGDGAGKASVYELLLCSPYFPDQIGDEILNSAVQECTVYDPENSAVQDCAVSGKQCSQPPRNSAVGSAKQCSQQSETVQSSEPNSAVQGCTTPAPARGTQRKPPPPPPQPAIRRRGRRRLRLLALARSQKQMQMRKANWVRKPVGTRLLMKRKRQITGGTWMTSTSNSCGNGRKRCAEPSRPKTSKRE